MEKVIFLLCHYNAVVRKKVHVGLKNFFIPLFSVFHGGTYHGWIDGSWPVVGTRCSAYAKCNSKNMGTKIQK